MKKNYLYASSIFKKLHKLVECRKDKKMYCSEFIYKVVNRSANEEIIHAGKRFMSRTFVTISNLYENKYSKLLQSSHKKIKE